MFPVSYFVYNVNISLVPKPEQGGEKGPGFSHLRTHLIANSTASANYRHTSIHL